MSDSITPREKTILELLHLPNGEIAKRLGLQKSYIDTRMTLLYQKMYVKTRTEMALKYWGVLEED